MANYQKFTAITEWSREVTPRVWVARFALENPKEMDFLAGQYCSFKLSESIRRTFSISTSPEEKHAFEICADIRPMGPGSVWLMNLKPGDPVEFVGPLGKFVIDRESPRDRVFIATGTGIAPIRSMIYETLESNGKFKGKSFLFW